MLSRLALRPDLNECTLEERTLLAAYGMVTPAQFFSVNPFNNSFVPGTGGSSTSAGGSTSGYGNVNISPNLTVFNAVMLGMNLTSQATVAVSLGGTSLSGMAVFASGLSGVAGVGSLAGGRGAAAVSTGGGGGGSSSGGGNGPSSNPGPSLGYGSAFSTGYNFALTNANNYGTTTPVGSIPVATYNNSDFDVQAPEIRYGTTDNTNSAILGVGPAGQGPASSLTKSLLGNGPAVNNALSNGPVKIAPTP